MGWNEEFNSCSEEQINDFDMSEFFEDILRGRGEFWDNV